ncbi:MAG: hypothetical protein ACOZDD_03025 [Bacteroidota bacterium]
MKRIIIILFFLFPVYPDYGQTSFGEESGVYGVLLNDLKHNLYENSQIKTVTLDGEKRGGTRRMGPGSFCERTG